MGTVAMKALLRTLGLLMARASRGNPWFRNQVNKDLVVEVKTLDGVAHHYEFVRSARQMISKPGPAPQATVSVCFDSAAHGLRALASPHGVGQIVHGALDGTVTIDGNASLLLWFWGLTRVVVPVGRHRPLPVPLSGALMRPDPRSTVYGRVTREPVAHGLDPKWAAAVEARATLINLRAQTGEDVPLW